MLKEEKLYNKIINFLAYDLNMCLNKEKVNCGGGCEICAKELLNEYTEIIKKDTVSIGAYEQVAWERDVAIDQLKQLGYELGEKIDKLSDKQKISELEDVVASLQCQIEELEDTIDSLEFRLESYIDGR